MMRPGFSLIEILIALTISSFVGVMIITTISLLQRSSERYNTLITVDAQQETLCAHLTKDLSSIVMPLYGFVPDPKDSKENQYKAQQAYQAQYALQLESEGAEGQRLKSLTFVTTSLVSSYGSKKPRLARVRYLLMPDERHPTYFNLVRQESPCLPMADFEKDVAQNSHYTHTIVFGLKACSIRCVSITMRETNRDTHEMSSWSFTDRLQQQSKNSQGTDASKKPEPINLLPQLIRVKGSMGDFFSDHEYPFSYAFFIPIDPIVKDPEENVQPVPPKTEAVDDKKPATPPGKPLLPPFGPKKPEVKK